MKCLLFFYFLFCSTSLFARPEINSNLILSLLIQSEEKIELQWSSKVIVDEDEGQGLKTFALVSVPRNYNIIGGQKLQNKKFNYKLSLKSKLNEFKIEIIGAKQKIITIAKLFVDISPLESRVFLEPSCHGYFDITILKDDTENQLMVLSSCKKINSKKISFKLLDLLDQTKQVTPNIIHEKGKFVSKDKHIVLGLKPKTSPSTNSPSKLNLRFLSSLSFFDTQRRDFLSLGLGFEQDHFFKESYLTSGLNLDFLTLNGKVLKNSLIAHVLSEFHLKGIANSLIEPFIGINAKYLESINSHSHGYVDIPLGLNFMPLPELTIKPSFSFISNKSSFSSLELRSRLKLNRKVFEFGVARTKYLSDHKRVNYFRWRGSFGLTF
ncbi:MAG: hypothetical protein CME70_10390 [Halobacteriovorax sp.]|nr:hypothetical protein [Halobacteriovorax sp.]|tara:strand:+ start:137134 stop:138273 length:1140 start_codon:yes stop_codon:yes gene_type:complete